MLEKDDTKLFCLEDKSLREIVDHFKREYLLEKSKDTAKNMATLLSETKGFEKHFGFTSEDLKRFFALIDNKHKHLFKMEDINDVELKIFKLFLKRRKEEPVFIKPVVYDKDGEGLYLFDHRLIYHSFFHNVFPYNFYDLEDGKVVEIHNNFTRDTFERVVFSKLETMFDVVHKNAYIYKEGPEIDAVVVSENKVFFFQAKAHLMYLENFQKKRSFALGEFKKQFNKNLVVIERVKNDGKIVLDDKEYLIDSDTEFFWFGIGIHGYLGKIPMEKERDIMVGFMSYEDLSLLVEFFDKENYPPEAFFDYLKKNIKKEEKGGGMSFSGSFKLMSAL
jgi:hypothetical protein